MWGKIRYSGLLGVPLALAGCGESGEKTRVAPVAHEVAALTAPLQVSTFALLASSRIITLDRPIVSGGHVGVAPGTGDSISTGFDARWAQGKSSLGQRIVFKDRAAAGDLFANSVSIPAGNYTSLSAYTAPPAQPHIVTFTAGTGTLAVNSPTTLAAGNYGAVTVNSVLTLSGGTYQLQSLAFGVGATVQASAATVLRVATKITGSNTAHLVTTGTQPAGNLRVTAAGIGANGGLTLGTDAQLKALVLSRSSITIGDRLTATGAIAATVLNFGHDAHVTFSTGFECNSDTACDDGNPCTVDSCADGKCSHTPAPNGTACTDDGNLCTSDVCASAVCTHPAAPNGTACASDGNDCTADACLSGACAHAALPNGMACGDDGNTCTADACFSGICAHTPGADGTPCVGACPGCTNDRCLTGICTHVPLNVFVNCVAELSPGHSSALFGYESTAQGPFVVPLGALNHIEPASSLPDATPPIAFDPGLHLSAFWVPLDTATGAIDWVFGSGKAHATPASPACNSNAYPIADPTLVEPQGETHAPVAPSTPTPPSSFYDVQTTPAALASLPAPPPNASISRKAPAPARADGAVTADLVPPFAQPFKVNLTFLTVGTDGCFASRDLDAEVFIDGASQGIRHLYDDGCVFCVDDCIYAWSKDLAEHYEQVVSVNVGTVPVRIKLVEHDGASNDDTVLDKTFNIDNHVGQPDDLCTGGKDGWGICFNAQQTGLPPDIVEPRLCASFKGAFMDSDLGEDDPGVVIPGAAYREYPGSYASAFVEVTGPLGSTLTNLYLDADGCVPAGVVPKENFAFIPGVPPGEQGSLKLQVTFNVANAPGGGFRRPDGVHYTLTSKHYPTNFAGSSYHAGDVPLDTWTDGGVWKVPPSRIDVRIPVLSPVTNVASVLTTMLARDDMGFMLDDPTTPADESGYLVEQGGRNCGFIDLFGRNYCESWGTNSLFSLGYTLPRPDAPSCQHDSDCTGGTLCYEADCAAAGSADCRGGGFDEHGLFLTYGGTDKPCTDLSAQCYCAQTDDSRWKFVISHEAGHQIENRGIGALPNATYSFTCPPNTTCTGRSGEIVNAGQALSDPPLIPEEAPFCSCKYVTVANSLHCLQSIERVEAAQAEGFGQFYSSRSWNRQDQPDCNFGYYKEFLDRTCQGASCLTVDAAGETGYVNPPPFRVNCQSVHKWRNHNCPIDGRMGTELDWLGVLYNLNSVGSLRSPMSDIFNIYRQACLDTVAPDTPPTTNPPACVPRTMPILPTGTYVETLDVAWEAEPPILDVPSTGEVCLVDTDCHNAGETCRDISVPGSVAPCASTNCVCKSVVTCTTNADCATPTTCRDDAAGSPAPCTDGTCVCKNSKACTTDADCNIIGHGHCRDDSVGLPPCTDGSCICLAYPRAGFLDGAKQQYAGDLDRLAHVQQLGDQFGVSRNLAP